MHFNSTLLFLCAGDQIQLKQRQLWDHVICYVKFFSPLSRWDNGWANNFVLRQSNESQVQYHSLLSPERMAGKVENMRRQNIIRLPSWLGMGPTMNPSSWSPPGSIPQLGYWWVHDLLETLQERESFSRDSSDHPLDYQLYWGVTSKC